MVRRSTGRYGTRFRVVRAVINSFSGFPETNRRRRRMERWITTKRFFAEEPLMQRLIGRYLVNLNFVYALTFFGQLAQSARVGIFPWDYTNPDDRSHGNLYR